MNSNVRSILAEDIVHNQTTVNNNNYHNNTHTKTRDALCELLECLVHTILYELKIYPLDSFEDRKRYSVIMRMNKHKLVINYVRQVIMGVYQMIGPSQGDKAKAATAGGSSIRIKIVMVVYFKFFQDPPHNHTPAQPQNKNQPNVNRPAPADSIICLDRFTFNLVINADSIHDQSLLHQLCQQFLLQFKTNLIWNLHDQKRSKEQKDKSNDKDPKGQGEGQGQDGQEGQEGRANDKAVVALELADHSFALLSQGELKFKLFIFTNHIDANYQANPSDRDDNYNSNDKNSVPSIIKINTFDNKKNGPHPYNNYNLELEMNNNKNKNNSNEMSSSWLLCKNFLNEKANVPSTNFNLFAKFLGINDNNDNYNNNVHKWEIHPLATMRMEKVFSVESFREQHIQNYNIFQSLKITL